MTTYGDLITQILIFFVLLFALSSVDQQKFQMAMTSLQGSFGIMNEGKSLIEGEFIEAGEVGDIIVSREEHQRFEEFQESLEEFIEQNDFTGVQISMEERGLVIRFVEGVLFDSGKADIKPDAKKILDGIAPLLKRINHHVRVEGHTDNRPIHTKQFPSNWELSTARAVNVVRFFIEQHDFSPYIISAAGYGEYRPVAPNDTEKHRALNRRVDIVILKSFEGSNEPK